MRRIFAILLGVFVGFLVAYGLIKEVKATVDSFILNTAGPTVFLGLTSVYTGIITSIGIPGFAALVLGFGFLVGIVVHLSWVKADWKLRRWGHERTSRDLGLTPVTSVRTTTPVSATTRPEPAAAPVQEAPATPAPPEEKKTESKTA